MGHERQSETLSVRRGRWRVAVRASAQNKRGKGAARMNKRERDTGFVWIQDEGCDAQKKGTIVATKANTSRHECGGWLDILRACS